MSGFQNCVIYGNVGKPPEIAYTKGGAKYAKFSVAVNKVWRDRNGDKQEDVTWFRCEVWNEKTADVVEQYLNGGDPVLLQGEIRTFEFEGRDGQTVYGWSLHVTRLQLMGGRRDDSRRTRPADDDEPRETRKAAPKEEPFEDDIPF